MTFIFYIHGQSTDRPRIPNSNVVINMEKPRCPCLLLKMPILSILCNSAMSGSLGFEIEVDFGGLAAVFLKQVFICETMNID